MEKWKRFERLTAALHVLQMGGATVTWDDHIEGYQIDVSVRFRLGPYDYLQIIECRDHRRPVTRDEVAAFTVTKEQTHADKGIFVSTTGFQSGAHELAMAKDIDLFTLEEIPEDWSDTVLATLPTPFLGVRLIRVRPRGQKQWIQVNDQHAADFMSHARFVGRNDHVLTVDQAYQDLLPEAWRERTGRWIMQKALTGEWVLKFHGMEPLPVDAVQVEVETFSKPISIVATQPPELRPSRLVYRNTQTDASEEVATKDLPFGFDTTIQAGRFYADVEGREYYCESVADETVDLVLLASRQLSRQLWFHLQGSLSETRGRLVEIVDPQTMERLRKAYGEWVRAKEEGLTRSHGFFPDLGSGAVYTPPGFFNGIGTLQSAESLWTPSTSVEMEVRLPDGNTSRVTVLENQPSDPQVTGLAFVPTLKTGDPATVFIGVFDQPSLTTHLCTMELVAGGDFVQTPTSPTFGIRAVKVLGPR